MQNSKKPPAPDGLGPNTDCVIYARYSSHNQREVSIEQQVKECEDYARYNDLRVVKVYADRALTGTSDKRPQFQKMLKDAERGRWAFVLCWKVDRFARNRYDSATYKYRLKRHGVRVIYAKEAIPDGPEGILLESILEGSAEYYSANLAQNVKRGLRFNAEACLSNGRIPFGYRKGADGHFEILESEAAVVREIFERSAAGEQYARILEDLKARGVPTRLGGQWRQCTLRVILLNEVYRGIYHFGGVRVEGGVPRIVDDELWKGAQKRLETAKGTRVYSTTYLFTGKIRCGVCGEPMTGRTGTGRSGTYSYYTCRGRRENNCVKKPIRRELLEGRVVSCVIDALNDDGLVNWIADAVAEMQKREVEKSRVAPEALKAELAGVKKSIKGIMAAIEAGVFTASTKGRLLELEGEQERLEAAIADASLPVPTVDREAFVCWLTRFRGASNLDEETRREAVNALVWQVRVWDDHAEAVLNYAGTEEIVHVPLLDGSGSGSPDGDKGWVEWLRKLERLPGSIVHFKERVTEFVDDYLSGLTARTPSAYAAVWRDYQLRCSLETQAVYDEVDLNDLEGDERQQMRKCRREEVERRSLQTSFAIRTTYEAVPHPKKKEQFILAERVQCDDLETFLMLDLLHGFAAGHIPRRCDHCGRFFLLDSGYDIRYCENEAPDVSGKTCSQVGAHIKERRKGKDPIIGEYKRVYNRLKTRKNRGRLSKDDWNRQVAEIQDLCDEARRGEITLAALKEKLSMY